MGPIWLSNSMLGMRNGMWTGRHSAMPAWVFGMSHVHFWPDVPRGGHKLMARKVRRVGGRWERAGGMRWGTTGM